MRMRVIAAGSLLIAAGDCAAMEVLGIDIDRDHGVFTVNARLVLDASPDEVWAILNDLDGFARVDRAVVISHVVARDSHGNPIVHQRFCGCVSFLCKRIDKTDAYAITGPYRMEADGVDGISDLDSNHQSWQLLPRTDGRTEMDYEWVLDPAFWVPPLIGTYAVEHSLSYVVPRMGRSIEYWAAVDAGRPPAGDPPWPPRERCLAAATEDAHGGDTATY